MLTCEIHQHNIEEKGHDCIRKLGDHLGRAVVTGKKKLLRTQMKPGKVQLSLGKKKEADSGDRGDGLTDSRCKCGTADSKIAEDDQNVVEDGI